MPVSLDLVWGILRGSGDRAARRVRRSGRLPHHLLLSLGGRAGAELKDLKNDGLIRVVGHNIQVDATAFSLKGDQGIGVRVLSDGVRWNGGTIEGFSVGMQVSGNDLILTDMNSRSCEIGVRITSERLPWVNTQSQRWFRRAQSNRIQQWDP